MSEKRYLSEMKGRSTNLQLLRFIAAVLVIMSHAFSLGEGSAKGELFFILSKGTMTMGNFAVMIFLFIGGYLITGSILRRGNAKDYFLARIVRIFPMLVVVAILSAFVVGPIYTNLTMKEYFTNPQTYKYLLNGILVLNHNLPGVFENNIYGTVVNGGLWTLQVEVVCYIGCFILYKMKLIDPKKLKWTIPAALVGYGALYYLLQRLGLSVLKEALTPFMMFYIGMLFYVYKDKVVLNYKWTIAGMILFIVPTLLGFSDIGKILGLPYLLIMFCYGQKQKFQKISILGNYSYGIYLVGFVIQQCVTSSFGGAMNPFMNMVISILLSILISTILYKVIEEPAIKLYNNSRK